MFRFIAVCVSGLACFSLYPVTPTETDHTLQTNQQSNSPETSAEQQATDSAPTDSSQAVTPVADDAPHDGNSEARPDFHPDLLKALDGATGLNPNKTAFLNLPKKKIFLKTRIACNDCLLEMLVCTAGSKEHEAVLSFDGKAYVVHTALLAMGIKPGRPVTFSPEFTPPEGPELNMKVHWRDNLGQVKSVDAKKWMRTAVAHYYAKPLATPPDGIKFPFMELRYDPYNKEILWFGQMKPEDKKTLLSKCDEKNYQAAIEEFYLKSQPQPMNASFVFAGSFLAKRAEGLPEFYAGEDGYLVCVANFAAATIDIKEASSASDGNRAFEANSEVVPPRGTPVILEISPAKD